MPAGWKWIAPDLRGHGFAPTSPATMDDCAADLVALWNDLGIERSHVVGYSMGGRLALHVAVRLPRSEEHTSELQSQSNLVCRLLLEKKKITLILGPHRPSFFRLYPNAPRFAMLGVLYFAHPHPPHCNGLHCPRQAFSWSPRALHPLL